jgi:hypothetical protein
MKFVSLVLVFVGLGLARAQSAGTGWEVVPLTEVYTSFELHTVDVRNFNKTLNNVNQLA